MSDNDAVTVQSGSRLAYEWVKHQVPEGTAWQSQRLRYLNFLSERCVVEALRIRETEHDLCSRLIRMGEILDAIKHACAFDLVRWHWRVEDVPEDKRKKYLKSNEIVWQRHDVNSVYDLGYEGSSYPGVDRDALAQAAAEYLERPWLRMAALDWLIVDAFITDEVVQYGASLKVTYLPGPRGSIERIAFDAKTKGNVQAIKRLGAKYKTHPILAWIGMQVGIPASAIGSALYFQAWRTALAIVALAVFDYLIIAVKLTIWGFRRMRATPEQLRTPEQRDYSRLLAMHKVHRMLEGPIINPKILREEMARTTEGGAVWASTAWAIVDRVIAHDPNVWITSFPSL